MTRKLREYHRPSGLAEALALLQRADLRTAPLALGPRAPDEPLENVEAVVDLSRLDLAYLAVQEDGLIHLGAAATLQQLAESPLLKAMADGVLAEAAWLSAGSGMRRTATVGGALHYARQAAMGAMRDGPPELLVALLVLDAEVVISGFGSLPAVLPLDTYLLGGGQLRESGLLIEARFTPPGNGARGALARVARTPRDQAIVAAVALVVGGSVRLAVAPGGVAPHRVPAAEHIAAELGMTDATSLDIAQTVEDAVNPPGDFRASAEYRRVMAGVMARRALAQAAGQGLA